jgi:hypothetical protein
VSRQLDDLSGRVADNVQVLALDYALRAAIAQRDRDRVPPGSPTGAAAGTSAGPKQSG